MKRLILIAVVSIVLSGCGFIEAWYDAGNYESITNERGTIELYSGGVVVKRYENARVVYANSDSQALFIEYKGKIKYVQGDIHMDIDSE